MRNLHELRVLVVEDDYVIAMDLAGVLSDLGAQVLGPAPSAEEALRIIREHGDQLDAAILDINLGSQCVYPVADVLRERRLPFVFATGYDAWTIPEAYRDVPRCDKPVNCRSGPLSQAHVALRSLMMLAAASPSANAP